MGSKSGFTSEESEEIKRLFVEEGRSTIQIAKILGRGSKQSVRNVLAKARIKRRAAEGGNLERFHPGQTFGNITLIKRLAKSKKLRYHVACRCGYEFDVDPYRLTLADGHKDKISECQRCRQNQTEANTQQ